MTYLNPFGGLKPQIVDVVFRTQPYLPTHLPTYLCWCLRFKSAQLLSRDWLFMRCTSS